MKIFSILCPNTMGGTRTLLEYGTSDEADCDRRLFYAREEWPLIPFVKVAFEIEDEEGQWFIQRQE